MTLHSWATKYRRSEPVSVEARKIITLREQNEDEGITIGEVRAFLQRLDEEGVPAGTRIRVTDWGRFVVREMMVEVPISVGARDQ
jgi:hypothetical protein